MSSRICGCGLGALFRIIGFLFIRTIRGIRIRVVGVYYRLSGRSSGCGWNIFYCLLSSRLAIVSWILVIVRIAVRLRGRAFMSVVSAGSRVVLSTVFTVVFLRVCFGRSRSCGFGFLGFSIVIWLLMV